MSPHYIDSMGKITSLDVARKAGVSQSAVSRTFTEGASVSKVMAKKVRKAAHELDYRPNILARSLITGRSRIIALVVGYLDNQFYPDALEKFSRALQEKGYHVLVFFASNESDRDAQKVVDELIDYQVDGIIAASVSLSHSLANRCKTQNIPIMLFNRRQDNRSLSSVTSDNFFGACKATEYLLSTGHQKLAHISGWGETSTGQERASGFKKALKNYGIKPLGIIDGMYKQKKAIEATKKLFSQKSSLPDAIFVGNDHMAFSVIDTIRYEFGLRIPEDVSVVGYDDVPLSSWPAYDLTTVRQPMNQMIQSTIKGLINLIQNNLIEPTQVQIEGKLIIRGSTTTRNKRNL